MSVEATIRDIQIQPIKGGGPLTLTEALMTKAGLETVDGNIQDHFLFAVDANTDHLGDHNFLTQRVRIDHEKNLFVPGDPKLALIKPEQRGDDLSRVIPVQVWEFRGKAVEVPIISEWLSDQIKRKVLVARTSGPWDRLSRQNFEVNDNPIRAQDGYPIHAVTWADVQAVFDAIGAPPDANRFRYQLLLDGVAVREIHDYGVAYVNGVEIHFPKPCGRCEVTGIDQEQGEYSKVKPLAGLARLKMPRWQSDEKDEKVKDHIVGENLLAMEETIIRQGDIFQLAELRATPLRFEEVKLH
jgi:uncharacterized protein